MSARSTAADIRLADLEACTDVSAIFTLFRKLRYPIEASPVAVPLDESDLPGGLRDGIAARYPVARIGGARPGEPALDVTMFVLSDPQRKSSLIRGIAQMWTRRFPGDHLLVFAVQQPETEPGFDQITFVSSQRLGEGADVRVKLQKLIVERRHPTRHDADTLNRIAMLSEGMTADALYKAQCDAFNVERITNEFYREYARRFRAALERIRADNPGPVFADPARLHTFTQRLFGRVMFLYFLQKKGALNGDQNFITSWYRRAIEEEENFYLYVLEPLFFDTLNQPRSDQRSPKFGRVPYLNGGLFAADEDDHVGLLNIANELFDPNSPDGLLYFLNTHNFTVEEDTPLEVEVALDPEMLGKVFENLLEEDERGKTGTFYTPRPVVAFMCREALAAYLTRTTGLAGDPLGWLLDEAETGEPVRDIGASGERPGRERLTNATLPRTLRDKIEHALVSVRVLDPAVGSGAFPLGMLALLVGVRRVLYRVAGVNVAPEHQETHLVEGWKRVFIRDCLYGVDIKREAIEIARLRLWLSLVVDADPFDMEPLPNLDYKLMDGDSLIETFEGVEIFPTRPAGGPEQASFGDNEEARRLIAELHNLQNTYFQPDASGERAHLKQRIHDTEVALVESALRDREANERLRLQNLLQKLANLGGKAIPPALAAEQQTLTHSISATEQALRDMKAQKQVPFFLYGLHFAPVFAEKDGFDIVIANPPYVRHEKIAPATLATLKDTYKSVAHGMADLYVYFYARALQLLHDGGTLAFISSNKFFRAGYGKGLRDVLAKETTVRAIVDFGDFPVFDAAAYPCIVVTDKGAPAPDHTYRGLTAGPDIELDKLEVAFASQGQAMAQLDDVQPPTGSASLSNLLQKVLHCGVPLRGFNGGKMYYGIKTGLNEAFVIDQATHDRLIAEDSRSAEVLKPFLRGRDASRYRIADPGLYLLYIGWHCDITRYPGVLAHLENHRELLSQRTEVKSRRIPWYALSRYAADYHEEFSRPKVLTVRFGLTSMFAFDEQGFYCNNAMSFFAPSTKWLTAILNSSICSFCLVSICPSVQNGYSQFFLANIEQLPIVEPSEADKQRLAALVDALQASGGTGPQAEAYEREVDEIVCRTYGLSRDDIAEIERWHAERRALLGNGKRRPPADHDS